MHTDKNYTTARDRISESLACRVARNSSFPYGEETAQYVGKNMGKPQQPTARSWGLEGYPLASVYAPLQVWRDIYDEDAGFHRGTIFKELDLPFVCGEKKGGNCRGK